MPGHRFQILLDDERYERVTSLARDRKVSVAAVIREAMIWKPRRPSRSFRSSHTCGRVAGTAPTWPSWLEPTPNYCRLC
jgi:hypothetical protein